MNSITIRKWFTGIMVFILISSLLIWYCTRDTVPREIRIATAKKEGVYYEFGQVFKNHFEKKTGRQVSVIETDGSIENQDRLLTTDRTQKVDLAILQGQAAAKEGIVVVAPLYPDVVHIIVRNNIKISSIDQLKGKKVLVGAKASGMKMSAREFLPHYGLSFNDIKLVQGPVELILNDATIDAAILTTGIQNQQIKQIMLTGNFKLIPIMEGKALEAKHAYYNQFEIPRGYYSGGPSLPRESIPTIAATAFLVIEKDASNKLVEEILLTIYEGSLQFDFPKLLKREEALDKVPFELHEVSRQYFDPFDSIGRLANILESMAAIKELLFALGAGLFLLWSRWKHIKEIERQKEMTVQRKYLDQLLKQTMDIERVQIHTSDPNELKEYLNQVTEIKLKALEELSHEDLRGDRRFSIFLMQCANVIRKIQSRISDAKLRD